MKVLLACERSGGHVFPALALGKKLRQSLGKDESQLYYFATATNFKKYLRQANFKVYGTSFPLRGLIFEIPWRIIEAIFLLAVIRPQKIIGFGGRDSFFLLLFGSFLGKDTIIYEPNSKLGKSNKALSFLAKQVLIGFSQTLAGPKIKSIGVLLRENIKRIDKNEARKALGFDERPVLFCFGGSQGSSFLNKVMMQLVPHLRNSCQFIHLTGPREYSKIAQMYNELGAKAFVRDFDYAMENLYSAADLVVSRAGASTLGELNYYQLPSILIPLSLAGGHQRENAFYFQDRGAAYVIPQEGFSFEGFKETAQKLLLDSGLRQDIVDNLKRFKLGVGFEEFTKDADWL